MISNRSKRSQSGTTLAETVIAAAIIGISFAAIFELNAVCLRYIDSSKESVAALQGVQDRVEALRNLDFTKLTDATYVQNLMVNPANGSDFAKTKATERVTIDKYDTTTNPPTVSAGVKFKRLPGTMVTPSITGSLPSGAAVVLVNVKYTWSMLGGRSGSEQTETIISSGTKK
jgi:Tfp pilus assembly protein PilV